MKLFILSICASFGVNFLSAQTVQHLDSIQHDIPLTDLYMEELETDTVSGTMIVLAPTGFEKQRIGSPTKEQILVLQGRANFIFEDKKVNATTGTYLVIPANTPHRVEVIGEEILKMLIVQHAP